MDDDIQGSTYEKGGYHQLLGPLLKCNKQRYQYSHKMKKKFLVDLNKDFLILRANYMIGSLEKTAAGQLAFYMSRE